MYNLFPKEKPASNSNWIFEASLLATLKHTDELEGLIKKNSPDSLNDAILPENNTLLHHVAEFGEPSTVKLLLERGSDANKANKANKLPIHYAKNAKILELLIPKTEHINTPCRCKMTVGFGEIDEFGITALHLAVMRGDQESVKLLVEHGADTQLKSHSDQLTALDYAKQYHHDEGYAEIIRLLEEHQQSIILRPSMPSI